jgi:phosphatidylinositol kinase/protein kinase (PI-3  family)
MGQLAILPGIQQRPTELTAKISESVECRRTLDGREMGEVTSVEGQVACLIAEATNKEWLAMMFHGWKRYI